MRKSFFLYKPGMRTRIEDKINIDGYYVTSFKHDTIYHPMVFYHDGTHGTFVFNDDDSLFSQKKAWADMEQEVFCSPVGVFDNGGTYRIIGDTLETDNYIGFYPNLYWGFYKNKFKIIDRNHICLFQSTLISYDGKDTDTIKENIMYTFVPVSKKLPETGLSSKMMKWFWKDKEDWKKYVRQMKQEQKLMKQKKKEIKKQKKRQAAQ